MKKKAKRKKGILYRCLKAAALEAAWMTYIFAKYSFRRIPHGFVYPLAVILYTLINPFLFSARTRAERQIARYGPGAGGIRSVSRSLFFHMTVSFLEIVLYYGKPLDVELVRRYIRIRDAHVLDRILSEGKGFVAVSGHFGNFPLIPLALSAWSYPVSLLVKAQQSEKIERSFGLHRKKSGMDTILAHPRAEAVRSSLKALRKGRIVLIFADENKSNGIYAKFLGRWAATAPGPAIMALKAGTYLVPLYIVRKGIMRHEIVIEPPISAADGIPVHSAVMECTQRFTSALEKGILEYPDHWWWFQKRWKTQPKEGEADFLRQRNNPVTA